MAFRDILPNRMQSDIAYGDYMNAEADINRLQGLNQNLAAYRDALQEAQKAKFVAGEQYLSAINASRANAGQAPFTGWPEEAMGGRRVLPVVDRMGYPLTPQEEAMYAQASPRRVVPLTPAELATSQPAVRPNVVDTSYSGLGADFGAEEPAQAAPSRVVKLTPEELAAFNARNNFAQGPVQQQQEAAPMYPEREHELRRRNLQNRIIKANRLTDALIQQNPDYRETLVDMLNRNIKASIPEEQLKSFDESIAAKSIMSEVGNLAKTRDMAKIVYQEIQAAENETNSNRKRERLQSMIPKLIQSSGTGGTDAMQIGEFLLNAPELVDYQLWAQTLPGGAASVTNLATYLADPKKSAFIARPDDFISKVKGNYNSIAETRNARISEHEAASSPEWFKKTTGLKRLNLFKSDIESELGQQAQPQAATPVKPGVNRIRYEMDKSGKLMPIQD
jgi:hypothetical protein